MRLPAFALQMAALLALGVALVSPARAAPGSPAPPFAPDAYHATHTTSRVVPGAPADVKAWLEQRQIVSFFPEASSLPRIAKIDVLTDAWLKPGGMRRVTFVDGNTVEERVVTHDASSFRYQIWGFTSSARFAISYIDGRFDYAAEGTDKTKVTWTYRVKPRWSLMSFPADRFLSGTFVPVMEAAMDNVAKARAQK